MDNRKLGRSCPFTDLRDAALEDMEREGRSKTTMNNLAERARRFATWFTALRGRPPRIEDFDGLSITEFVNAPGARGKVMTTISRRSYGSDLRALLGRAILARVVPPTAMDGLVIPPPALAQAPGVFSDAELDLIFGRLEAEPTYRNLRLRAFVQIMLDAGPRPTEVIGIQGGTLRRSESTIVLLYTKGGKAREVPVGQKTWQYLDEYFRVRGTPRGEDAVFLNTELSEAFGYNGIAQDFLELLREVGIRASDGTDDEGDEPPPIRPRGFIADGPSGGPHAASLYTMRRTFAAHFADAGGNVDELAAIMGHSPESIPMLFKLYYRTSRTRMQRAHDFARPGDAFHEGRARRRPGPAPLRLPRAVPYAPSQATLQRRRAERPASIARYPRVRRQG